MHVNTSSALPTLLEDAFVPKTEFAVFPTNFATFAANFAKAQGFWEAAILDHILVRRRGWQR